MHRFFANRIDESHAELLPDEAKHALQVLRLLEGAEVQILMEENIYSAVIESITPSVSVLLHSLLPSPEPKTKITLYQGLPKGDKMEFLIQKCVESGVHTICPVQMTRSIAKIASKEVEKKTIRFQRIANEAAKQAGRAHTPQVTPIMSQKTFLQKLSSHDLCLVAWEEGIKPLKEILFSSTFPPLDIAIVIGPEGGIPAQDVDTMKEAGAIPITLGKRIFRTETAGLASGIMTLTLVGEYE